MKRNNFLLLVIVFCFGCSFYKSQNIRAIYEVDFKPSKQDFTRQKEMMLFQINTVEKKSIFKSLGSYQIDSINMAINQLNSIGEKQSFIKSAEKFSPQQSSFKFSIIKDLGKESFLWIESVEYAPYLTSFSFPKSQWKLTNGKKIIKDYNCREAQIDFGGRHWTAFYTSEIPIQDGPYKFHGLPGLILEVKSTDGDYLFSLKSLEKVDSKDSFTIPKNIAVNPNQLQKLKENFLADPAKLLKKRSSNTDSNLVATASYNGKEISSSSNELIKQIEEETKDWQKTHNNFIEKKEIWMP